MRMPKGKRILITGRNGQLGKALAEYYPEATAMSKDELDISDINQVRKIDWSKYDIIINAAAYVNADQSESEEGREISWKANAVGPRNLAEIAIINDLHLIHISSEYVFDGTKQNHREDEVFTPLSVYGQTKAAADIVVSLVPKHHIIRVSWVVGDGHNFIKTMKNLADLRVDPKVVDDQFGRLTFTSEITRSIEHIFSNNIDSGTYNVSNSGEIKSWAEIAADTFELAGHDRGRVKFISTEEYQADKERFAPRPRNSDMDLSKIQSTGFVSANYDQILEKYIENLKAPE